MASARLVNVKKIYAGNVQAVADFNVNIQDKEFIILVGPSGCGKSTTLRMIAGLEDISQGELYIDEKKVNDVPPKDRDIAMVFQNYALYPHMSVADNMGFALKLKKVPKEEIKQRVTSAAKILDIEHLLDRKPKALSGGQRQRVALGRAIVRKPKLFLLDEPLSNLDAKLRVQMRTEIIKLYQKLQTTFIYVTHDQTEAMTMGTRIVVMKDGYIQQINSPAELYENPDNLFVATFIGSPQMNAINAKIIEKDNTYFAAFGESACELSKERFNQEELKKYLDKEIIIGIRPEDIYLDESKINDNISSSFYADIEVIERLGAENYLYAKVDNQDIVIRTTLNIQASVKTFLCMNKYKIHIFDIDTTQAICRKK